MARFMAVAGIWLVCLLLSGSLHAAAPPDEAAPFKPDENTLLLLHFDETEGTEAKDASAKGLVAKFDKAPNDPEWYEHGRFGGCVALDGEPKDEGADKKADADGMIARKGCQGDPKGSGFTAELWARHARLTIPQFYLSHTGGSKASGRYIFGARGKRLILYYWLGSGQRFALSTPSCLQVGVWHHVAFTYDKKHLRIYCDGVEKVKKEAPGEIGAGGDHTIVGRDTDMKVTQIRGVCGCMDELRISNVARTEFPKSPFDTKAPMPEFTAKAATPAK